MQNLNNFLWGPATIFFILFTGIYLSFITKYVQFQPIFTISKIFTRQKNSHSPPPFFAFCVALGGTLGVGNISGVAVAITTGGSGAIFWMLFMSFFGMAIKYIEIYLTSQYRNSKLSSPMKYIFVAFNIKFLYKFYAICALLSGLTMGGLSQSNAVAGTFSSNPLPMIGIFFAILTAFIILGGGKRIMSFCSITVPIMAVLYVIFAIICLFHRVERIIPTLLNIFFNAFSFESSIGGFLGFLTSKAIKAGFSKGIFSNESGLGTAAFAHQECPGKNSHFEGLLGVLEVFIDTFVFCFLTALIILTSDIYNNLPLITGSSLTILAFSETLGSYSSLFIQIMTILLALTSIVGWSYYASFCISSLNLHDKYTKIYKYMLLICVFFGSILNVSDVYLLSDVINFAMILINLSSILTLFLKRKSNYVLISHFPRQ